MHEINNGTKISTQGITELTWTKGHVAPEPLGFFYGAAAVDGKTAYFSRHYNLYSYQLAQNKWSKLKQSQYQSFGLTVVDSQLTTVGGIDREQNRTRSLLSLTGRSSGGSKKSLSWTEEYPEMLTHRVCPAVLTTATHVVVAGGRNKTELATVEVMSRQSFQWSKAASLPDPIGHPHLTLCDGYLYVSEHQSMYSCSIEKFLHTSSSSATTTEQSGWIKLADAPLYSGFSLVTFRNRVLAVGGQDAKEVTSGAIHSYNAASDEWSAVGEMPTPRADTLAVFLPVGQLVVVGGWSALGSFDITEIGKC